MILKTYLAVEEFDVSVLGDESRDTHKYTARTFMGNGRRGMWMDAACYSKETGSFLIVNLAS